MLFKRGRVPWNKGLTKETDPRVKKMAETKKGIPLSEEHRKKISESESGERNHMYGKHVSEETKQKISEAMSGENNPMYGRKGEQNPFYGKYHSEETKRKMSKSNLGQDPWNKGLSKETDPRVQKLSKAVSGKNNSHWRGGKSFELYGSEFNDALKEQIRERDNYQCQLCWVYQKESSRSLDVHHIDYNKKNNYKRNLVSLCVSCHAKTNVNRDEWEAYFKCILSWREVPLRAPLVETPPLPRGFPEPVSALPQVATVAF
ncbi:hypothetical protein ES703_66916 [subsurface metagenome]